jgi:Zn-dependent alcohol dehydrogenase
VTHRMRLDEFKTAMDLMDRGECGKVVMHPAE